MRSCATHVMSSVLPSGVNASPLGCRPVLMVPTAVSVAVSTTITDSVLSLQTYARLPSGETATVVASLTGNCFSTFPSTDSTTSAADPRAPT